jgi:hypothetical protein
MSHLSISAVRADTLFASALQPSAEPSLMQIRQAIAEAISQRELRRKQPWAFRCSPPRTPSKTQAPRVLLMLPRSSYILDSGLTASLV